MKKNKKDNDYNKIRKEVKHSFYNYDKIFLDLIISLGKCETQKDVTHFKNSLVDGFKDAPDELVIYLNDSIRNKIQTLIKREDLDLGKLRAISNRYR